MGLNLSMLVPVKDAPTDRVERTLRSIVDQQVLGLPGFRVAVDIVGPDAKRFEHLAATSADCVVRVSERADTSMYDCVARYLEGAQGDLVGYLSAGDELQPQAMAVLDEMLPLLDPKQAWITGMICTRRSDGALVRSILPPRFRRDLLKNGIYGTRLPGLQQESTFWSPSLIRTVDLERLRSLRLAGDLYLWSCFARVTEPLIVECQLASFRWHGDNASANWEAYLTEANQLAAPPRRRSRELIRMEALKWAMPNRLKHRLSGGQVRRFHWPEGPWV
jgi:hypothetical protein